MVKIARNGTSGQLAGCGKLRVLVRKYSLYGRSLLFKQQSLTLNGFVA